MDCIHHEKIEDKCKEIDSMWDEVHQKTSTKTLISILAISVTIVALIVGILHLGYTTTISELKAADVESRKEIGRQSEKMACSLSAINVSIAQMDEKLNYLGTLQKGTK